MRPKILLLDEPHPKAREIIESVADVTKGGRPDIVYTQLTPVEADQFCYDIPVFCPCTGIDHIKAPKVIYLDEHWKANEGRKVTSTAEHTWHLALELAKINRMQLYNKKIGIIGKGRIGSMVMNYACAFGMDYYWYDTKSCKASQTARWNRIIKVCDIITVHIPLLGNEKLLGNNEFVQMKHGTLLINTSRQSVVDIDALKPYLISSKIKYADDFKNDVDLTQYGAIQTPHIAGSCKEAREATDVYIATQIVKYIKERDTI
jgi:phosphoglycerate dehydrogenase-like enzyme